MSAQPGADTTAAIARRPASWRHEWTNWLIVAAIGVHIVEEYALNFNGWARAIGVPLTAEDFHLANAGVTLYAVGCAAIGWRLPSVALSSAALVALNAAGFHLGASIVTGSYSPGTATALALFLPAAAGVYAGAWRDGVLTRGAIAVSLVIGLGWHVFLGGVFYVKYFSPLYP
ncbi:MAG: HXXEE domain-containing protein [Acidobacteriota bacterium]